MAEGGATRHNPERGALAVVIRHKWKVLTFFIMTVTSVTAYTYLTAEIYRSEAKLLLQVDRQDATKPEVAILTSRRLAEDIVAEFGPEAFLHRPDEDPSVGAWKDTPQAQLRPVRREVRAAERKAEGLLVWLDLVPALTPQMAAVRRFEEGLSVEVEKNSNILTVALESQNAGLSRDALARLVQLYLARRIEIYTSKTSSLFFEEQAERLRKQLILREKALEGVTDSEPEYSRLLREKDLTEKDYQQYRDSIQRARIEKALEVDKASNVRVVQEATYPLEPIRPNKPLNLILGAAAGLLGGVALAFAAQYVRDTLESRHRIR